MQTVFPFEEAQLNTPEEDEAFKRTAESLHSRICDSCPKTYVSRLPKHCLNKNLLDLPLNDIEELLFLFKLPTRELIEAYKYCQTKSAPTIAMVGAFDLGDFCITQCVSVRYDGYKRGHVKGEVGSQAYFKRPSGGLFPTKLYSGDVRCAEDISYLYDIEKASQEKLEFSITTRRLAIILKSVITRATKEDIRNVLPIYQDPNLDAYLPEEKAA